ncbi:hypothetical protein DFH11DRAFT_1739314 [Phellopilus nigrolimitatus]|nr:hypothetical protein DFH11DRAFT_1739314 [Phellopilus nigrolimitatus]
MDLTGVHHSLMSGECLKSEIIRQKDYNLIISSNTAANCDRHSASSCYAISGGHSPSFPRSRPTQLLRFRNNLPVSSAQSIMSGRSFGSRRITLRMRRLRQPKSAAHTEPEDDSVTVSSRDTRLLVQKTKTVMNGGSGSTMQDFHTLYGLESESHASAFDEKRAVPRGSFCSFRAAEVVESSKSIERNTQWLRDQTLRTINGIMTPESVVSDGSSLALSGDDLDSQSPFDGDLALHSSSAASASAAHDDVSIGEHGSHRVADWRDPKLHWLASQAQSKSGSSDDYPSPSSSSNRQSASSLTSDPLPRTADTPPEVRQLVPPACTDCSACGVLLDAFFYVCSTCGERTPRSRASAGANGHANGYTDGKGKARADVSMFDPLAYPPRAHTNGKPFPARPRALPMLPSAPSAPSASSVSSSSTVAGDGGYELCPGCFETAGVLHALAGGAAPDEPTSASPEDQRTLSQLRRAAPRQKGHFRHAYLEKLWSASGWKDVEQDNISGCTICNTSLTAQRYKCASCKNFVLCRACYSQVHENHPSHAFLDVPDRPLRSRSEPDLELTNNLNDDGLGDESLTHPDVKCAHCLMDIVGACFHCAICESVDICSNCEAAGLPGNLDADDGGHNTSHIMIKIPIPLNSSKVQTASRRARQLWTGRDLLYVQRTPSGRVRADSLREADTVTIIGSGSKHARGSRCDRKALDHRIACKGCNQSIVGVRFQCATFPATKTQSYSLCTNCEQRSYLLHDPMHIFFKLPRPVDRPIESQFAILPILYRQPAGPAGRLNSSHPKAYLATLYHNAALCDHCMDRIKGVWFRCVYCVKDLCDVCENLNSHAHDRTHFFYVFKAPVDMQIFRIVAELDNLEGSPPVLNYPVYYSACCICGGCISIFLDDL